LLSDCSKSRDNNFNLLRFIAATLVLYSHSYAIQIGDPAQEPLRSWLGTTWGTIAVDVFFITSGFLIAGSFFNRKSVFAFAWARILRIFPGLLVANLISVFIVGLVFTQLAWPEYLQNIEIYKFLVKNTALIIAKIQWVLPGVFLDNPLGQAVNGSLWTLPHEVRMYALLSGTALLVLWVELKLKIRILNAVFIGLVVIALSLKAYNYFSDQVVLGKYFVRLFAFFFIGALFYLYAHKVVLANKFAAILFALVIFSAANQSLFAIVYTLSLPYLIFYIAYVPAGKVRAYNKVGDYSYGMYVYAYPIQQALIAVYPEMSLLEMILYSFVLTLVMAYCSWHVIEKKALALKNYTPRALCSGHL